MEIEYDNEELLKELIDFLKDQTEKGNIIEELPESAIFLPKRMEKNYGTLFN